MIGWLPAALLVACAPPLDDHCTTARDADGEVLSQTVRDMRGGLLRGETVYLEVGGAASSEAEHTYSIDQWVRTELDASLGEDGATQETVVQWNGDNPREVVVNQLPDGTQEARTSFTWTDGQLVSTSWSQGEIRWEETWTWSGDTVEILQTFGGDVVVEVREQRTYADSAVSWPVLIWQLDLPGRALVERHVDADGDGSFSDSERVFERTLDEDGIPESSRSFADGELFAEVTWSESCN
jgi:hypothetical protein